MKHGKKEETPRIIWPVPGPGLRAVFVGDAALGIWVHWSQSEGRSVPCSRRVDCPLCLAVQRTRWVGYVAAALPGLRKAVIQVTAEAMVSMLTAMDMEDTFRGIDIHLIRSNGQRTGRVDARIMSRKTVPASFPAFDVLPSLTRLFGPIVQYTLSRPSQLTTEAYFGDLLG